MRRSSAGDSDLRQVDQFVRILSSYRAIALLVALSLAGTVAVALVAGAGDLSLVVIAIALGGMGLAGLYAGYRMIRGDLLRSARATHAVMASVHRDALTGVFTRSYFMEALRRDVHHGSDKSLGYLLLDMDNLKVLNDGAGHAAGDAALTHLARSIAAVMPGAVVGRLGGDEFGIAIPDCDNRGALRRLGEELLRRLDQPVNLAGRPTRLSATIGMALAPADATDVDDLIAKADLALYKGKKAGRRQVVAFDPDMLGDERHRRFIERELRAALLMDELELHYQPVFGADMRVRSHEALLRWRHTVRGMIPPAQFIAIAEESDLIDKLG
ncbi:MAG TPA: diguanylate cyclase, partial [Devosia sp.]|nr:diguanylate cyclase [Devosia sp.]